MNYTNEQSTTQIAADAPLADAAQTIAAPNTADAMHEAPQAAAPASAIPPVSPSACTGMPSAAPADETQAHCAPHTELGKRGENAAAAFLERHGFDIIERNWTCPAGEVDIIASNGHSLHFVEVKTRNGTGCGFPEEAVDEEKRQRYERIAEFYLKGYAQTEIAVRFDIIAIVVTGPNRAFLRMHRNAFCCS